MISFFRAPIRNTKPSAQASILQIYKYIISNRASDVTRQLRAITDPKEARKYKSEAFDYVTFSGCFSSRSTDELIEHSGFLCFDIDKIESEERLLKLKSDLVADEELHTVLLFRSPSGNGLKWVVEVPDRVWLRQTESADDRVQITHFARDFYSARHNEQALSALANRKNIQITDDRVQIIDIITQNHKLLYERIRGYLFEQYGIETDHTSDIARPCYLCHDVDAYYDEPTFRSNPASRFLKSTDLTPSATLVPLKQGDNMWDNCKQLTTNKNNNDYENDIEKIVREIEYRRIDITNDYHDWMLVAMALAGTCGANGEHYFHRISQFHPKYDNAEAHRMYQSCVRNTHGAVGIGTIVYLMHNA